jgi:hypothetical protein
MVLAGSLVGLALLVSPILGADADKAQEVFDSLFGDAYKKAMASKETADDVALAAKMLEAANGADNQPGLQALLCEKAAELGAADVKGYETATTAAELLIEKVPDKEVAARELLLRILQKRYDAAKGSDRIDLAQAMLDHLLAVAVAKIKAGDTDEALKRCRQAQTVLGGLKSPLPEGFDAVGKRVNELVKTANRVAGLKNQVKTDPANHAARNELVRVFFAELDSPVEAAKYMDDTTDPSMRKYIPAMVRKVDEVPELASMELGEWLRGQADSATGQIKANLLRRALAYYDRYLSLHKAADMDRTKIELAQKTAQADLDKLGGADSSALAVSFDLVKLFTNNKDIVLSGTWERKGKELTGSSAKGNSASDYYNGRIQLPIVPQGNYEIEIRFSRVGGGGLWLHLPIPSSEVMMVIGSSSTNSSYYSYYYGYGYNYKPAVAALEQVRQRYYYDDSVNSVHGDLEDDRVYTLKVDVTSASDKVSIAAFLENQAMLRWIGPAADLSVYSYWKIPQPRCVGLGVGSQTTVKFLSARLRMLSGKGIPLDKFNAAGGSTTTPTTPAKGTTGKTATKAGATPN